MATTAPFNLAAALTTPAPARDYVIPGLIAGSCGAIVSPGGVGKSMLGLQIVANLSGSLDSGLRGSFGAPDLHKTLYLSAEDPPEELHNRVADIAAGTATDRHIAAWAANCEIITTAGGVKIDTIVDADWLAQAVVGKRLVIIDTLRRVHGRDENNNGEMAQVLEVFERIARDTKTSFLILHHVPKPSLGAAVSARGASAISDNLRYVGTLRAVTDKEAAGFGVADSERWRHVVHEVIKCNYGMPPEPHWYAKGRGGRLELTGTVEAVLRQPEHPYTQALLGAVPELRCRTHLTTIPGGAARPSNRPSGCFFHPRCPVAGPPCRDEPIAIVETAPQHWVRCIKAGTASGTGQGRVLETAGTSRRDTVLEVRDLAVSYGVHRVLDGVNFAASKGECLAIVGESGSGKSTLSRALIGLVPQQSSTVLFHGDRLASRARDRSPQQLRAMQYIFQSPHNSLNPRQTVEQIVGLVHDTFYKTGREQRRQAIADVLGQVGLAAETMHMFPDQLSGGQRQRVAIARALTANPDVLVCDEITSALDVSVQAAIINLLKDLQQSRQLTMLFVTHNLALVRNLADRVLVLDKGKVVEIGDVRDVLDRPEHPYTRQLLANALVADLDHRAETPKQAASSRG